MSTATPSSSPDPDSTESNGAPRRDEPKRSELSAKERRRRLMRDYSRYSSVGAQFGLVLALFALAGYWVDTRLGSSPIFLVLGVLFGFGGGLYSLIKKIPVSSKGRSKRSDSSKLP